MLIYLFALFALFAFFHILHLLDFEIVARAQQEELQHALEAARAEAHLFLSTQTWCFKLFAYFYRLDCRDRVSVWRPTAWGKNWRSFKRPTRPRPRRPRPRRLSRPESFMSRSWVVQGNLRWNSSLPWKNLELFRSQQYFFWFQIGKCFRCHKQDCRRTFTRKFAK